MRCPTCGERTPNPSVYHFALRQFSNWSGTWRNTVACNNTKPLNGLRVTTAWRRHNKYYTVIRKLKTAAELGLTEKELREQTILALEIVESL